MNMENSFSFQHSTILSKLLLFTLSVALHLVSIEGDWVYDDIKAIVQNPDADSSRTKITNILVNDFWGTPLNDKYSHKSFRPVTTLTFRAHSYFSKLDPRAFRCVNVVLNGLVTVLFHDVCLRLFPRSTEALRAALLFAVHPVHTEAVCSIVGRAELLAALFFLLVLLVCTQTRTLVWQLSVAFVLTCAAMLSKEQGIMALLVGAAMQLCATRPQNIYQDLSFAASCLVISLLLLFCRLAVTGVAVPFEAADNPAAAHSDHFTRFCSLCYVHSRALAILVYPWNLCSDWSMGSIPLVLQLGDLRNIAAMSVATAYAACLRLLLASPTKHAPFASGIYLLSLPYLPACGLFVRVGFVIAERVLYLPSMGVCILASLAFRQLRITRGFSTAAMLLILIILSTRTTTRCSQWRNELTLFAADVRLNPKNAKLQNNFGLVLKAKGHVEEAIGPLRRATTLHPSYSRAYYNLGNAEYRSGLWQDAMKSFQAALITPDLNIHASVYSNLGLVLLQHGGDLEKATAMLRYAVALSPGHAAAWNNLGNAYLDGGNYTAAINSFERAVFYKPNNLQAHMMLGEVHYNMGKQAEASEREVKFTLAAAHFEKVLMYNPSSSHCHLLIGIISHQCGKIENALHHFEAATLHGCHFDAANAYNNWGALLASQDLEAAEANVLNALKCDPSIQSAHQNLALIRKRRMHNAT